MTSATAGGTPPGFKSDRFYNRVMDVFAIVSALLIALGVIWSGLNTNTQLNQQQKQFSQEQDLARQRQVSEQFSVAIDQLGSNQFDVRIGGIYALERLMKNSPRDKANIIEVLSLFIRAPIPDRVATDIASPRPDVNVALTVLGRPPAAAKHPYLDLTGADLNHAFLNHIFLSGSLVNVDLTSAHLRFAHLSGLDLTGTYLQYADLYKADLRNTDLSKVQNLRSSQVQCARVNGKTRFPPGVIPSCPTAG